MALASQGVPSGQVLGMLKQMKEVVLHEISRVVSPRTIFRELHQLVYANAITLGVKKCLSCLSPG